MKITESCGFSAYHIHLHLALDEAVGDYERIREEVERQSPLTEDTATPALIKLHWALEEKRAAVILLAAACVEAVANLYLGLKATSDQFALLQRATFIEKWTVVPSLFVTAYVFPTDGELYQDLKRLHERRNALAHLKEEVSREGVVVHNKVHPKSADDEHIFICRCRSLPARLVSHLATFDTSDATRLIGRALEFNWSQPIG